MTSIDWYHITQGQLGGGAAALGRACTDTRSLQPQDVFFALKGPQFDGHHFLKQAVEKGAGALVVEQANPALAVPQWVVPNVVQALGDVAQRHRRVFTGPLVAITGSCGKTTLKGLLRDIFRQEGPTLATEGNLNNHIGVPLTLFNLTQQHRFAVIEMGASGQDEIAYLTHMAAPQIAMVNNVLAAHIEGFGSLAGVEAEKLRIYEGLSADGTAVIALNEPYALKALAKTAAFKQVVFAVNPSAERLALLQGRAIPLSLAHNVQLGEDGCASFDWHIQQQQVPIRLRVLGPHNVANALAAATCAWVAGASLTAIQAGLFAFTGEKGRMQAHRLPTGAILVDDTYNANPGSVAAAITYLAQRSGTRHLVLGDMKELGENAAAEHFKIGQMAKAQGLDVLWACGEFSGALADGFGQGARAFSEQALLATALAAYLQPHNTFLIKGSRSARMENIVNSLLQAQETPSC